jgi:hypothetical protein
MWGATAVLRGIVSVSTLDLSKTSVQKVDDSPANSVHSSLIAASYYPPEFLCLYLLAPLYTQPSCGPLTGWLPQSYGIRLLPSAFGKFSGTVDQSQCFVHVGKDSTTEPPSQPLSANFSSKEVLRLLALRTVTFADRLVAKHFSPTVRTEARCGRPCRWSLFPHHFLA